MTGLKHRDDLPKWLYDNGLKIGVEIGCNAGEYTEKLCEAGLEVYTIDPWTGFSGQGRQQKYQEVQERYFLDATAKLKCFSWCHIMRKTSMEALAEFKDNSLDFVYIDGDHNFRHVAEDIFEWSKKVRVGGVIAGHDYWNTAPYAKNIVCHVRAAVDAYVGLFDIKNLHILNGDKFPSWMYIKT